MTRHHVNRGSATPRIAREGIGPKYRESQLRRLFKPNSQTSSGATRPLPHTTCVSSRPMLSRVTVALLANRFPLTEIQPASPSTSSPRKPPLIFSTGSAPPGHWPLPTYPRIRPFRHRLTLEKARLRLASDHSRAMLLSDCL